MASAAEASEDEHFSFESADGSSDERVLSSPSDAAHEAAAAGASFATSIDRTTSAVTTAPASLPEYVEPVVSSLTSSAKAWEVLDRSGIQRLVRAEIEQVAEVSGIAPQAARVLLSCFGWDVRSSLEQYSDNPERVMRRAGLAISDAAACVSSGRAECETCLEQFPAGSLVALAGCGHRFCKSCWQRYLSIKIKDGESCRLKCMSLKCGIICSDESVAATIHTEADVAARFHRALEEAYVEENRTGMVKWCPSAPHCGHAVRLLGESTMELVCEVACVCEKRFCFSCLEQAHTPCSCEMWKRWCDKEAGENATSNWIQANSKPCPKCKKNVFKDGGCNHVTCRCGQSFCWHCGQSTGMEHTYESISNHSCGSFKEEAAEKAAVADRDLKRYMHYYDRWRSHANSFQFESTQERNISDKIECLDRHLCQYLTGADYSWLREGAAQLSVCRRILSHSYVFAYFSLGPTSIFADEVSPSQDIVNRNLFEMKQADLESTVEALSRLVELSLEKMLEPGAITTIKQKVLDLTVNMDLRTLHLCETVQNDILGKLSCPQGVAPYHPSTQVVQGMASRRNSSQSLCSQNFPKRRRLNPTSPGEHGHLA